MGQTIPQQFRGSIGDHSPHGIVLLNYSPDWLTVYYRRAVSPGGWSALAEGFAASACGLSWRLELSRETPMTRVASDEGVWVKALDPGTDWSDAAAMNGAPSQYPCEIQIQGHSWARGVDAFELLESLEQLLGLSGAERICGRVDLAADFGVSLAQYDHLVCGGSLPAVSASWVTRARSSRVQFQTRMEKRKPAGEVAPTSAALIGTKNTTLYLGARGGLQLSIYRKDADFEGNTGAILHDSWRSRGWNGGPVARVEARFSREWLREHWIDGKKGANASPETVIDQAGALWRLAAEQYRLAPPVVGGNSEKRKRPTSEVWALVQRAWDDWEGLGGFAAVEQVPDRSKLVETAGKRIEDLRLAFSPAQFNEIVNELFAGLPGLAEYRDTKSRWRKYGYRERSNDEASGNKIGRSA